MSLFSQKDQLTYAGDNGSFPQRYLKDNVTPINIEERMTDIFVLDGGWLLHQTRWEKKSFKWGDIIDEYAQFIKIQGHCATNIVVVFDGCQSSTKDHVHRMHQQKQFCNQKKIVGKTHHIQQKKNTSLMAATKLSFFFI